MSATADGQALASGAALSWAKAGRALKTTAIRPRPDRMRHPPDVLCCPRMRSCKAAGKPSSARVGPRYANVTGTRWNGADERGGSRSGDPPAFTHGAADALDQCVVSHAPAHERAVDLQLSSGALLG